MISLPAIAAANPHSIVPSGGEAGTAGTFSVLYEYTLDKSVIVREANEAGPIAGAIPTHKDLLFHQYTHTITPQLELGVFPDTWITVGLPIIIAQSRELQLADGVDRADSSTVRDGFVPAGGFDAMDPTTPPGADYVFRGVTRHGLSHVDLGLSTAFMNQRRDDTKPTWKFGAAVHLALGKIEDFDRENPADRTGVSNGVHELKVWTSIDKKIGRFEPWFEIFWQAPIATRSESLFQNPGYGSTNTQIGQTAGGSFGVEAYAVDDDDNHISLDVGARVISHFEGRGYSEMFEVFSYAGDDRTPGNPLIQDSEPDITGIQPRSHAGITNIEGYLETSLRTSVRARLGPRVHVAATVDIAWKTDHAITFADAGIDLPMCQGASMSTCETEDNDVVSPGTKEVNPLYSPKIDLVGHRYRVEDSLALTIGVMGELVF